MVLATRAWEQEAWELAVEAWELELEGWGLAVEAQELVLVRVPGLVSELAEAWMVQPLLSVSLALRREGKLVRP